MRQQEVSRANEAEEDQVKEERWEQGERRKKKTHPYKHKDGEHGVFMADLCLIG